MVATINILTVDPSNPLSVGDLTRYYTANTSTRYYTESGERPGVWFGRGAKALGLKGHVSGKVLRNLFMGKRPGGHSQLVKIRIPKTVDSSRPSDADGDTETNVKKKKRPAEHVPGYDITFSVPKSVSALWAIADEPTRRLIEEAIRKANRQMLKWMEDNLKFARRGKGGRRHEHAELVIAMFDHTTARNDLDPSLHTHCVVLNLCRGVEDGKWSKVDSHTLLRWVRTIGPLHRNTVLNELTKSLGVEAYRPGVDGKVKEWFELQGISQELISKWSSRRKEILKEAELFNGNCSSVTARQNANLRTRQPKGSCPSNPELRAKWQAEANALGQTAESVHDVIGRRPQSCNEARIELALQEAAKACVEDRAYFSRQKFIQKVSEQLQDVPISGLDVLARADAALLNPKLICSLQVPESQESIFTTKAMWEIEAKLLNTVDRLRASKGATVSSRQIQTVLKQNSDLSPQQTAATRYVLEARGSMKCLTGVAGAGKTRTLNAIKSAYEMAGYRVVGTALSGAAKEELAAKAGIDTRTVKSYEYHLNKNARQKLWKVLKHELRMLYRAAIGKTTWKDQNAPKIDKSTVLIIDEAGMLDTPHMALLTQTALKSGATIIAVGDDKQLNPIGPGGSFARIARAVPTFHLSENFRQRNSPEDAQAAALLREGKVDEMLESYVRRGRMTVSKDRTKAVQALVTEWAKDGGTKTPNESIILTQTRSEAAYVNRLCQMERQLDGQISNKSVRIHGQKYHVGDRVMFHAPRRRDCIENGHQATVTAVNPITNSVTVKLDRDLTPQQRKMKRSQVVTLTQSEVSRDFLTLAYAATTHKLQGQSCPRAYCLLGGSLTNRELTYVQITRGELMTKLFTDRHHAGTKLADLAEAIKKSGRKELAHEQGLRLSIQRNEKEEQS